MNACRGPLSEGGGNDARKLPVWVKAGRREAAVRLVQKNRWLHQHPPGAAL